MTHILIPCVSREGTEEEGACIVSSWLHSWNGAAVTSLSPRDSLFQQHGQHVLVMTEGQTSAWLFKAITESLLCCAWYWFALNCSGLSAIISLYPEMCQGLHRWGQRSHRVASTVNYTQLTIEWIDHPKGDIPAFCLNGEYLIYSWISASKDGLESPAFGVIPYWFKEWVDDLSRCCQLKWDYNVIIQWHLKHCGNNAFYPHKWRKLCSK